MNTQELTKNLIEARKKTLLDPKLSHAERVSGIRSEISELQKPQGINAGDALNFALPFTAVALAANSAINHARTALSDNDIQGVTSQIMNATKGGEDAAKNVKAILAEHNVTEHAQKKITKMLSNTMEKLPELTDNAPSQESLKAFEKFKSTLTDTLQKSQPFGENIIKTIDANMPGGAKGAAVAAAFFAGLAVFAAGRKTDHQYRKDLTQDLKQELSYVEMEALRKEVNELKTTEPSL